jgi:membrane-bound lytic murein transglycosylase D
VSVFAVTLVLTTLAGPAAGSQAFPRPEVLQPNISFWRDVFAAYSEHQVVVHDDWYLDKVYEVLDFRDWTDAQGRLSLDLVRAKEQRIQETKEGYRYVLRRLHEGARASELGARGRRVAGLFANVSGRDKYLQAAERIRSQSGLRERFSAGLARLRGYLPEMERILRSEGVPAELAYMPMIESCFNLEAYSKVGAAGVWQFMPSTGRQYMIVDSAVDERRDPLRSTHAAAEHLRTDYEVLGTWPMAVTAYNHGRGGIARASRTVGSKDIGTIVRQYRGPSFGFASRNFYAEFLAALDVAGRSERLFGSVTTLSAPRTREVPLRGATYLHDAARRTGVGAQALATMNPALMSPVLDGRRAMPRGYRLRVPISASDVQLAALHGGGQRKVTSQPRYVVHEVKRGQTLQAIARRYGTTVKAIQGVNQVRRPSVLQIGQRLRIPRT